MVEDYKDYGERRQRRPRSIGSSILVISHVAILIVGISVGYWINGQFSTSSGREKNVSRGGEKGHEGFSQSGVESVGPESTEAGGETKVKEMAPVTSSEEEESRFTFYEALPNEILPGADAPEKGEKQTRPAIPDAKPPLRSEVKTTQRAATQEPALVVYYVQVASFHEEGMAGRLRDRLAKNGYTAETTRAVIKDKGIWYRVRVGPFEDEKAAKEAARAVANSERVKPLVLSEEKAKAQ